MNAPVCRSLCTLSQELVCLPARRWLPRTFVIRLEWRVCDVAHCQESESSLPAFLCPLLSVEAYVSASPISEQRLQGVSVQATARIPGKASCRNTPINKFATRPNSNTARDSKRQTFSAGPQYLPSFYPHHIIGTAGRAAN